MSPSSEHAHRIAASAFLALALLAARPGAQAGPWSEHAISPTPGGAVQATDVDRDGRLDVACGPAWWRRPASGAWSARPDGLLSSLQALDLEGDGDVDFVGVAAGAAGSFELAWSENLSGNGLVLARRTIAALADPAPAVEVADVDGDGDMDVLCACQGELLFHENASGDGTVWNAHALASAVQSIAAADVDGDGDADVLLGSASEYRWLENAAGDGSVWSARSILGLSSYSARRVGAADVDGDGAVDALFSSATGPNSGPAAIGWFRNSGGGSAWTLHGVHVDSAASPEPPAVLAADLDRDGDADLVELRDSGAVWYEQAGGAWLAHDLPGPPLAAGLVVDLDRDGDRDLVGSGGALVWRENETPITPYGSGLNPPRSLTVTGTPALGQMLVFGIDNPLGTQAAGARVFLSISAEPEDGFPAGEEVPNWGMAGPGATGELLVSYEGVNPIRVVPGPVWAGPGVPAEIPILVPRAAVLVGASVYAQGLILDRSVAFGVRFGLTNALRVRIGP